MSSGKPIVKETGKLFEVLPDVWSPANALASGDKRTVTYDLFHSDAFEWLAKAQPNSIHAVVTDPPYGLVEYSTEQLRKKSEVNGGIWRIPPSFDGCKRSPLPRFSVLGTRERNQLHQFFRQLASQLVSVLVPGGHVFVATNPLLSIEVYSAFVDSGFEVRGEIIRLVQTLRGGDRPKNAEKEFSMVSAMPRSCWEPWGLFRKPCDGSVSENLRKWKTGGLRRISDTEPFKDVIESSVARGKEREMAPHPSLKPQHFMRKLVRAALPLEEGVILDPFMGSGSTIAAAAASGLSSVGLESNVEYFQLATQAVPRLAALQISGGR